MVKTILLVKIETQTHLYIPYGMLYTANALRQEGYEVEFLHIFENELNKIYDSLKRLNPFAVCFSVSTAPPLIPTIEATRKVKELGYTTIWGGMHTSVLPEIALAEPSLDFGIQGDGEIPIAELLRELEKKGQKNFKKIKGLVFKEDNKIIVNQKREFLQELDNYEPAFDLIDVKKYFMNLFGLKKVLPVITSRGCPFRCAFCYNLAVNNMRWSTHSVEKVKEIVSYLHNQHGMDGIFFHDDNFFTEVKRAKQIVEAVKLPWSAEVRANVITQDVAEWMKQNQCKMAFVGAESGSQRMLDYISKNIKREDLFSAAKNLAGSDITLDMSFILGFPNETKEERGQTFSTIAELQKINPQVNATVKIYTPYPGTPLYAESLRLGFKPPTTNEEWARFNRATCHLPWADNNELETMHRVSVYAFTTMKDFLPPLYKFLHPVAVMRYKSNFYKFPLELQAIYALRASKRAVRKLGII